MFREQAALLTVRGIGWERQLELKVNDDAPTLAESNDNSSYPIGEAHYIDKDQFEVIIILHAGNGRLRFLEIFKPHPVPVINRFPPFGSLTFTDSST